MKEIGRGKLSQTGKHLSIWIYWVELGDRSHAEHGKGRTANKKRRGGDEGTRVGKKGGGREEGNERESEVRKQSLQRKITLSGLIKINLLGLYV